MALFVRTRVVRLGVERWREGDMLLMTLFARYSEQSRFKRGKLDRERIWLSVKSIASCWSFVTPRFSMAGILHPEQRQAGT